MERSREDRLRKEHRDAMSVLYGALMSDLSISIDPRGRNARVRIEQDEKHIDWLQQIREALETLGVGISKGQFKTITRKGERYGYLYSRTSPFLTRAYYEWKKPNGVKRLPDDFKLYPATLAHWFMGDGSARPIKKSPNLVELYFGFKYFSSEDIERLHGLIKELGIKAGVYKAKRGEWRLMIMDATSVNRFLDIVEPCIAPSFREDKVKRPWLRQLVVNGKLVKGPLVWKDGNWSAQV